MTPERLFSILNLVAIVGWVPLVFLPRFRWARAIVPIAIPIVLAVVYAGIIVTTFGRSEGGFSSLADVRTLFENPWALLAGWVHYLAFDLLIGGWEVRDAHERGVPHLLVVPALILTFLFGPAGLLVYLGIRAVAPNAISRKGASVTPSRPQHVDNVVAGCRVRLASCSVHSSARCSPLPPSTPRSDPEAVAS